MSICRHPQRLGDLHSKFQIETSTEKEKPLDCEKPLGRHARSASRGQEELAREAERRVRSDKRFREAGNCRLG